MKFKEWITEGTVRTDDRLLIDVHSLEGIVDLAVDMDKRVIFDSDEKAYYVLEDTLAYVFYEGRKRTTGASKTDKLGSMLINKGYITGEELEIGLLYQQKFNLRLGESLIALNFIDENILHQTLARQSGIGFIELEAEGIDYSSKWFSKLTYSQLISFEAVPFGMTEDGKLIVVSSNPYGRRYSEILSELFESDIKLMAAAPSAIYGVLDNFAKKYPKNNAPDHINKDIQKMDVQLFKKDFENGIVRNDILVKHMGFINDDTLYENNIRFLVGTLKIDAGYAALILGLEHSIKMQKDPIPNVAQILNSAGFISDNDYERYIKNVKDGDILKTILKNHLVTQKTLNKAGRILEVFKKLLIGE